ncbi:MAG: type I restriction enzyme HsdR N-terminal domain-containing protein [Prevotella sp.]|nr:type I restriction enzyme HsdR N-terminal domain-containing protein [Prevotella sp.]
MQTKWNQFVYLLSEAKKKNVEESDYHFLIEQQLKLLGWFLFNGEICHKPSIHIGNSNHIQPDILIKKDGEEEFVIEVKRPSHKLVKKDVEQLQSYMRQLKLSVGIYIGEHIEVFYDMAGSKDAVSVLRIPLELNSNEGALFIDQFSKEGYDRARVLSFCKQRIDEMQHQAELDKLRDDIIAHPKSRIDIAMLFYLSAWHKDQFSEGRTDEDAT